MKPLRADATPATEAPASAASAGPAPDGAMLQRLVQAAMQVRGQAYAPYSRFAVGAALLDEHGRIHVGANVENAAYSVTQCAEASAIGAMVSAGGRRILAAAVAGVSPQGAWVTPCGACRQRLREFASAEMPVLVVGEQGLQATLRFDELLPHSFGPGHLPTV